MFVSFDFGSGLEPLGDSWFSFMGISPTWLSITSCPTYKEAGIREKNRFMGVIHWNWCWTGRGRGEMSYGAGAGPHLSLALNLFATINSPSHFYPRLFIVCEESSSAGRSCKWFFRPDHRQLQGFVWWASRGRCLPHTRFGAEQVHCSFLGGAAVKDSAPQPPRPAVLIGIERLHS